MQSEHAGKHAVPNQKTVLHTPPACMPCHPPAACPSTATYVDYYAPVCNGPAVDVCDSDISEYGVAQPQSSYDPYPYVVERIGINNLPQGDQADAFITESASPFYIAGITSPIAYVFRVVVESATRGTPITAGGQIDQHPRQLFPRNRGLGASCD